MTQQAIIPEYSQLERDVSTASKDDKNLFKKVADAYFKPKSFERSGKLYENLGVRYIKKAIMGTIGKVFRKRGLDKNASTYFLGNSSDLDSLREYEKGTRINELVHVPQMIGSAVGLARSISEDNYVAAAVLGTFLVLNASSTMLQRYNRAKVEKIVQHKEAKRKQFTV